MSSQSSTTVAAWAAPVEEGGESLSVSGRQGREWVLHYGNALPRAPWTKTALVIQYPCYYNMVKAKDFFFGKILHRAYPQQSRVSSFIRLLLWDFQLSTERRLLLLTWVGQKWILLSFSSWFIDTFREKNPQPSLCLRFLSVHSSLS